MVEIPSLGLDMVGQSVSSVGQGIESAGSGLAKLFPGWARRSEANAEIAVTKKAIASIGEIRDLARAQGLDDQVADYFCRDAIKRVTRNENLDQIVSLASPMVDDDANPEDLVGSEWLNYFVDHAERVSEEEVQRVWAAILSGEVNEPGTYSKMSMSVLSKMDKEDVDDFRLLCSFLASTPIGDVLVLAADEAGTTYNERAISYSSISDLAAMGLVNLNGNQHVHVAESLKASFIVTDEIIVFVGGVGKREPSFHPVLTTVGRELSRLCGDRNHLAIIRALNRMREKRQLTLEVRLKSDNSCITVDDAVELLTSSGETA